MKTKQTKTTKTDSIPTIENVALDDVTGGCSQCGCGRPDATGAQRQLAANWLQRR